MNRHCLPQSAAHPIDARSGNEIRFPSGKGRHNSRAREEEQT